MEHQFKRQSSLNFHRPVQAYANSVFGGAGGHGTKISTASYDTRFGSGFGGGYDYQARSSSGNLAIGNAKIDMQHLNDRLASYLETVRNLEKANSKLEMAIREAVEKRGPSEGKDYSKYYAAIADLRGKIFDVVKGNAQLNISFDNAVLASDDFRVKMENELAMRQAVEADVAKLKKLLDDTTIMLLYLEGDIESLKEELINLKKNHETDVAELRAQITQGSVHVDVDAAKGQDQARIMEEMRAKYETIALKNQEDLKEWHKTQVAEVQVKMTENTAALKDATATLSETRRRHQALDIELQSALSLKASLEDALHDVDGHYNMEVEKSNAVILRLQEELTQIRADIQQNSREYEHLLNVKVKLEAEIAEYRRLLDGGATLKLEDAIDAETVETKVVTVTQTLVNGKLVSEIKDVKSSEKLAS